MPIFNANSKLDNSTILIKKNDIQQRLTNPFYQKIRLIDVFLIGPGMIYISLLHKKDLILSTAFFLTGISTILFNGKNYLDIKKAQKTNNHE